jgi:hypothetical protein
MLEGSLRLGRIRGGSVAGGGMGNGTEGVRDPWDIRLAMEDWVEGR